MAKILKNAVGRLISLLLSLTMSNKTFLQLFAMKRSLQFLGSSEITVHSYGWNFRIFLPPLFIRLLCHHFNVLWKDFNDGCTRCGPICRGHLDFNGWRRQLDSMRVNLDVFYFQCWHSLLTQRKTKTQWAMKYSFKNKPE